MAGLASTSTAAVGARLAVLRLVGEGGVPVAGAPDLVRVALVASPDLDLSYATRSVRMQRYNDGQRTYRVSVRLAPIGDVHTLALAVPRQGVVPLIVVPLLVSVVGRAASPDLQLGAVFVGTVLDVEALAAECADGTTGKGPLLVGRAGTGLEDDCCAVVVRLNSEALVYDHNSQYRAEKWEWNLLVRTVVDGGADEKFTNEPVNGEISGVPLGDASQGILWHPLGVDENANHDQGSQGGKDRTHRRVSKQTSDWLRSVGSRPHKAGITRESGESQRRDPISGCQRVFICQGTGRIKTLFEFETSASAPHAGCAEPLKPWPITTMVQRPFQPMHNVQSSQRLHLARSSNLLSPKHFVCCKVLVALVEGIPTDPTCV